MKVCPQCDKKFMEDVKVCSDCGYSNDVEKFLVTGINGIVKAYEQMIVAVENPNDKQELINQKLSAEQFLEKRNYEKNGVSLK